MKTIIFAGPSISHQELAALTTADLAPPIRRGDINRFADYEMFVIIDGEFGQSLSVSPKEILGLLRAGKTVIGASSMGALRASELDGCGMIGVGWVYEHFASAAVRRDDDVALAYSPLDLSSVTIPVIEIEYWTTLLLQRNLVAAKEKREICQVTRRIFYAERTAGRLTRELERTIGPSRFKERRNTRRAHFRISSISTRCELYDSIAPSVILRHPPNNRLRRETNGIKKSRWQPWPDGTSRESRG